MKRKPAAAPEGLIDETVARGIAQRAAIWAAISEYAALADLCSSSKSEAVRAIAEVCVESVRMIVDNEREPRFYSTEEILRIMKRTQKRLKRAFVKTA